MPALPLARRPSSCGSCPSKCPSGGARSTVLDSNYVFDLGGAKRARTADLLHAMPVDFVRQSSRTSGTRTSGHMRCLAGSGTGRKSLGA
jgi:hypothetical protein